MKKLTRILAVFSIAALMLGCFAGCGEKVPAAKPTKTHDPVTFKVTGGTEYLPHNFVDGKCEYCDETTFFTQDPIGGTAAMAECSEKGTVIEIHYTAHSYYLEQAYPDAGDIMLEKTAYVYLPYGYDENDTATRYNVFYLMHGNKQNEGYWFKQGTFAADDSAYTKGYGTENVLDNLIKEGKAEKTIVVTPTFYSEVEGYDFPENGENNNTIIDCYGNELINDLMPYIAEHFNTYAASGSQEDLKAARDHQAYAGVSMGSCLSYHSVWRYCLEYFAYIGSFSAGATMDNQVIAADAQKYIAENPVKYHYACCGTQEGKGANSLDGMLDSFLAMQNTTAGKTFGDDIAAGENSMFMMVNMTGHNYATWITALYNCMQVFFKA